MTTPQQSDRPADTVPPHEPLFEATLTAPHKTHRFAVYHEHIGFAEEFLYQHTVENEEPEDDAIFTEVFAYLESAIGHWLRKVTEYAYDMREDLQAMHEDGDLI